MTLPVQVLLGGLVVLTWLGCIGFARLRTPLDRLHCASFTNVAGSAVLTATSFLADGPSTRSWKVLVVMLVSIVGGAALSHAAGQALVHRQHARSPGSPP